MDIRDKVVIVTGGASGIGRALCERFAQDGARGIVVADRDAEGAAAVGTRLGAKAVAATVNVADAQAVRTLVDDTTARFGQVDVFCSNAGIISRADQDAPAADWQRHWDVNVMAHVHAANAVLPQMLARKSGYLLQTASAAGLLSQVNAAPYTVTKHAAVGFAEWLSLAYGDQGIEVGCLCPQGVNTAMLQSAQKDSGKQSFLAAGAISPESVAEVVVQGMRDGRFLILPHAEVATFVQRKAADIERWLRGMRRLRATVMGSGS